MSGDIVFFRAQYSVPFSLTVQCTQRERSRISSLAKPILYSNKGEIIGEEGWKCAYNDLFIVVSLSMKLANPTVREGIKKGGLRIWSVKSSFLMLLHSMISLGRPLLNVSFHCLETL